MPFFEGISFHPNFEIKGNYTFNKASGWIEKATLRIEETVHPGLLYHNMNYTIEKIS